MRKIFALVALLTRGMVAAHADCQDGPYGLKINGSKVVDAPKFGDPDAQGRVQPDAHHITPYPRNVFHTCFYLSAKVGLFH